MCRKENEEVCPKENAISGARSEMNQNVIDKRKLSCDSLPRPLSRKRRQPQLRVPLLPALQLHHKLRALRLVHHTELAPVIDLRPHCLWDVDHGLRRVVFAVRPYLVVRQGSGEPRVGRGRVGEGALPQEEVAPLVPVGAGRGLLLQPALSQRLTLRLEPYLRSRHTRKHTHSSEKPVLAHCW